MFHGIELGQVLFVVELLGVMAFAVTGALSAIERDMDIFGVFVLALITALGGGIIRDVLITQIPVSLQTPIYFYAAVAGALLAILLLRARARYEAFLKVFDAIGLAIFSMLGAQIGMQLGLNFLSVLLLGLLTGIGGGILRDVLANEIPLVLRQEVYAVASVIGILAMWVMVHAGLPSPLADIVGALLIFAIRLAAIHWNLNLPRLRR